MDRAGTLDLMLLGVAVGAQLAWGLTLVRSAYNRALAIATILFLGSNLAFVMNSSGAVRQLLGPVSELLWLLQIGSAGLFWLFAVVLFEDRPLAPRGFIPAVGLTTIALAARFAPTGVAPWLWALHNLAGLGIALHAMFVILASGRVDLVDARRRLRVPFLAIVASYSILVSAAQLGQFAGFNAAWYALANLGLQAALGLAGAVVMLEARTELFGRAEPAHAPEPAEPDLDAIWLDRMQAIIARDALWRREGLTIADLATAVGLPEHRLRRLINDRLGHRNFPSFINQQRIDAAKAVLADPESAGRTVASIAYDLGFASLGPFNRAFRDATGQTPTEFRRRAFTQFSQIPDKAS
jgi:AraC-like DNA-binding protein